MQAFLADWLLTALLHSTLLGLTALCLARCLASVAASVAGGPCGLGSQFMPGMAHKHSNLVQRVERILGDPPAPISNQTRTSFCAAAGLTLLAFACSAPRVDSHSAHQTAGVPESDEKPKAMVLNLSDLGSARFSGTKEDIRTFPTSLAIDLHEVFKETEEGQAPTRSVEYTVLTRADSFPAQIQAGKEGEIREFPAESLSALTEWLQYLYSFNSDVPVMVYPQPGVFYKELEEVLDAVISAGFTNIAFVGENK